MFKILQKTVTTGIATVAYPDVPAVVSAHFRGRPDFDFASWRDARPAAEVCPTGAIERTGGRVSRSGIGERDSAGGGDIGGTEDRRADRAGAGYRAANVYRKRSAAGGAPHPRPAALHFRTGAAAARWGGDRAKGPHHVGGVFLAADHQPGAFAAIGHAAPRGDRDHGGNRLPVDCGFRRDRANFRGGVRRAGAGAATCGIAGAHRTAFWSGADGAVADR